MVMIFTAKKHQPNEITFCVYQCLVMSDMYHKHNNLNQKASQPFSHHDVVIGASVLKTLSPTTFSLLTG
jgi:hypothetical protein